MATQRVYRLPQRNSIQCLTLFEEPIPVPRPHEALIKVRSVSLNYRDVAISTGTYPFPVKDNVVPCCDLAGDVVEVGNAVEDIHVGDKVVSHWDMKTLYGPMKGWQHGLGGPIDGALREYIVLPAAVLVQVPKDSELSYSQLASIVVTGTTAWNCLFGNVPLSPGQTVLFLGTGGVSITGLILAKAAGATTIVTSSSDEKLRVAREKYGADFTINYNKEKNWGSKVLNITGGQGADYVFENGGAGTIEQSFIAVAYGGNISVIGFLAKVEGKMPDIAALALSKGANVRGIMAGSREQLQQAVRFITTRKLQVPVEREFGFHRDDVVAAFEYLQSGQHIGKICINVA